MNTAAQLLTVLTNTYNQRVLNTKPVAYWKLAEGSGTAILDSSGNGYGGTYTAVTWDGTKHPTGALAAYFDDATTYGDIYSAGLAGALNFDTGSLLMWAKVSAAGVWTDSANHYLLRLYRDADNQILLRKNTANQLNFYRMGNTTAIQSVYAETQTGWISVFCTWDVTADLQTLYINNVLRDSDSGLVASTGSGLDNTLTLIGAVTKAPIQVWSGYLGYGGLWNRVLTSSERADVSVV